MSTDERPIRPGPVWARTGFLLVVWLFVLCSVVQVFLAGLGVFAGGSNFVVHRDFGYLIGPLTLVLIVLALFGRLPRALVLGSVLLLVLLVLQSVFVALRSGAPTVAALHPVNGFLIVLVGIWLGARARTFVRPPLGSA
jgi:mercuric ion transport protein